MAGNQGNSRKKTTHNEKKYKNATEQPRVKEKSSRSKSGNVCPYAKKCGGCDYQGVEYKEQLKNKQAYMKKLLKPFCFVEPIVGMKNPLHYRHKVHAAFDCTRRGQIVAGAYRKNTHDVVDIESCMIEEQEADEIIRDIKDMLRSFRIKTYDEDTGYGLLRHVLVRKGYATGQIMVVLVLASPILPSKNNFVKALRKKHPNITTVVLNVNDKRTSMVLGDRNITLYGKGFIEDKLCGCTFRISPSSFYQVNPVQTELLYEKAIHEAHFTGKERVIDAYCGTGTIGIIAAKNAGEVIGVELNRDAIRDAVTNAKRNDIRNIRFYNDDAGKFMVEMPHEFLGSSVEGKDVFTVDDMISSGESMLDVAKELKKRKAKRVFVAATFGLFTNGLKQFDEYYEQGLISKVLTTNVIYQTPDLLSRPYYINVDLSKYIALMIDKLNYDHSISELLDPNAKIQNSLAYYRKYHK